MPSCKLAIVLDRPDRTFLPGEEVTGHVEVRADAEVPCKELTLSCFWRTHGKGNTAKGGIVEQSLFSGEWRAGEYQRYPFRFLAPQRPFTYRGNYLNVDHYVAARADVPWALDPKTEQEFILLPGPMGTVPEGLLKHVAPKKGQGNSQAALIVGVVLAVAGVLTFPCGIPLILIGIGIAFFSLKQRLAESLLGDVQFSLEPRVAAPGDVLAISTSFTPQKACTINQIYARVTCQESCVSGSGTNKSTHVHKVYSQDVALAHAQEVQAGRRMQLQGTLTLPETAAYSFDESDNDLTWNVEFRIDIRRWPDWVEQRSLVIVPRGHTALPATEGSAAVSSPFMTAEPIEVAEMVEERPPRPDLFEPQPIEPPSVFQAEPLQPSVVEQGVTSAPMPPAAAPAAEGAISLAEVLTRISQADRFNGQRQQLVEGCRGLRFPGTIVVDRVSRNFSYDDDPAFRDGRIVLGKPEGTDFTVSVKTPKSLNDSLDALKADDRWPLYCTLHKWDDLFNRAELRLVE